MRGDTAERQSKALSGAEESHSASYCLRCRLGLRLCPSARARQQHTYTLIHTQRIDADSAVSVVPLRELQVRADHMDSILHMLANADAGPVALLLLH